MQTILRILLVCSWFVQFAERIIPKTYSSEMLPKYISAAFSGHAHVRAYLDEQSEQGISKSSAEKGTCEKRIEVKDMRRSSA